MEHLKIAFFCWESLYAERVGGLANAATNLAETLAQHHEVHFLPGAGKETMRLTESSTTTAGQKERISSSTAPI